MSNYEHARNKWKNRDLHQEKEDIRKNQVENLEQYRNKKLSDELNNRVEETKERIRKLDNREIEMTQSERQRENGLRKNLEPQGALGL